MAPFLVDTHCHLDPQYFPGGPDPILARAEAKGVSGFVVIGVGSDLGPARAAAALAERRDRTFAAVGIHPHDAALWTSDAHAELATLAARPSVVAVGEIGLDYHYEHSPRGTQRTVFATLIGLAL